jgi:thiamine-phosphate pyrophosphorylase
VRSTDSLLQKIEQLITAGVDWVQIREKDLSGKELAGLTRDGVRIARKQSTRILLNGRLDVALAERAGGVHLPENGLPVREARRLLESSRAGGEIKDDFQVGVSCHSVESARQAAEDGADYIFFGPIFGTPSKEQFGAPQGVERLRAVCDSAVIPVLAIGGITLENAASCIDAGAAGIAAIRLFQDADDAGTTIAGLRALTADLSIKTLSRRTRRR